MEYIKEVTLLYLIVFRFVYDTNSQWELQVNFTTLHAKHNVK